MKVSAVLLRVALIAGVAVPAGSASAQQISNIGSLTPGQFVSPFGYQHTATYGETFTAPAGFMNDFTFWAEDYLRGSSLQFNGYVGIWNGTNVVGAPIWSSSPVFGTSSTSFVPYTFNTGSLALITGQTYVAFVNASNFIGANPGQQDQQLAFANDPGATLPGGMVYDNNGANFNSIYNAGDWTVVNPFGDLIFKADFSATGTVTPEPATMTLMATGLVGLVAARRRRKRSA